MSAINFKQEFVDKIKSGEKTCIIRRERKNRIIADQQLYLYTGMRTKDCIKIKDVICHKVTLITIFSDGFWVWEGNEKKRKVTLKRINFYKDLNKFAKWEGFKKWKELADFFEKQYGLPFEGVFINWGKPKKLTNDIIL